MAGFSNVAGLIAPALNELNIVANAARFAQGLAGNDQNATAERSRLRAQQDMALQQLQQMQDVQWRGAAADAETKRAQIALDAQNAEETRRAALKRAVARQRATFGASGIDTNSSGSAQAVLLGLFDESDAERAQREKLDAFRLGAINQDLNQKSQMNILQRTQLAQQHQLQQSLLNYGKEKTTFLGRFFEGIR